LPYFLKNKQNNKKERKNKNIQHLLTFSLHLRILYSIIYAASTHYYYVKKMIIRMAVKHSESDTI